MYSLDKKYKRAGGKGFVAEGGPVPDSHAAFNKDTRCWNAYRDHDGSPLAPKNVTEKTGNPDWWEDGSVERWVNDGTWIEYNPEEEKMNPIFGYQASSELNTDSWKQLVLATSSIPDEQLTDTFKEWEREFKEETKQSIPGAWRSAKSVIRSARTKMVAVYEESDKGEITPRGKTAVEKDLRGVVSSSHSKSRATPVITPTAHGVVPPSLAETIELAIMQAEHEGFKIRVEVAYPGHGVPFLIREN